MVEVRTGPREIPGKSFLKPPEASWSEETLEFGRFLSPSLSSKLEVCGLRLNETSTWTTGWSHNLVAHIERFEWEWQSSFSSRNQTFQGSLPSELYIFLFTFRFLFSNVWNCSKWSAIVTTPSSPLWITDGPSEMDHTLQTIRTSRLTHRHTLCFSIFIFVFLAYRHPRLRYRLATLVSLLWTHYFGPTTWVSLLRPPDAFSNGDLKRWKPFYL